MPDTTPTYQQDARERLANVLAGLRARLGRMVQPMTPQGSDYPVTAIAYTDVLSVLGMSQAAAAPDEREAVAKAVRAHKTEWRGDWPLGHFCPGCSRDVEYDHQEQMVLAALAARPAPVVSGEARIALDALRGEVESATAAAIESLGTVDVHDDPSTDEVHSTVTLDPDELPSRVWHEFKATALGMITRPVTMADFIAARDAADAQFSGPSGGQWALAFLAALGITVADALAADDEGGQE